MQKIKNIIFSIQLSGILLMLFAFTIAFATFIENDFGTEVAKEKVYHARWFEFHLLLLAVNLVGSIFTYKMYLKGKWTMLLFHLGFLIIFIGAACTRYIGFEGMMSIREGQFSNELTSSETYISVRANNGESENKIETKVFATPSSIIGYHEEVSVQDRTVKIRAIDYYVNVAETIVEEEGGKPIVWLVVSDDKSERQNLFLEMGDEKSFGLHYLSFNTESDSPDIRIDYDGNELYFRSVDSVQFFNMAANTSEVLPPDVIHVLEQKALYKVGKMSFVVKKFYESGKVSLTSTDGSEGMNSMDAILMEVKVDDQSKLVQVFGGKGYLSKSSEITLDGVDIKLNYGAKSLKLPFSLRLDDFQLERYPGSSSPSSYASQVTVVDEKNNMEMPYRIFMNNVLNYKGY